MWLKYLVHFICCLLWFSHSIEAHFASSPHRAMSLYDTVVIGCSVVVRLCVHLVLRDLELEIVTSLQ